ncbi:hypothetical protein AB0A95_13700 [Micromonospora sp. NPDC049230]|uniref:hypothetical protein n=1 Tax=Micromonospora sp. NPDC049230 TaxID=3155502 RepID=UPI0033EF002F
MQDDRARLLRTPRRDLAAARRGTSTWAQLAFVPESTGDGQLVDRNRAARFGVLWAAQYDRRPDDLPLLRFLLDQETRRYRETAPLGLGRGLELAGLLVAEHRQRADVWLHWQAKQVTFDTALGYRTHHLLTAGVAATVAAVRASAHPDRDRIVHEITAARNHDGTPHFTDDAVDDWLAAQRTRFPDHPDEETPRDWADHAALLGDREAARRFLLHWAATEPRTGQTLNSLQFGLAHLGFLDEAIDVQAEAVAVSGAGFGKASALLTLIRLHRTAGHFAEARQALRDCGDAMPTDPSGRTRGCGATSSGSTSCSSRWHRTPISPSTSWTKVPGRCAACPGSGWTACSTPPSPPPSTAGSATSSTTTGNSTLASSGPATRRSARRHGRRVRHRRTRPPVTPRG